MSDARKIFVIDTSVVLYDAGSLHSFQEHDVAVPLTVLEELDSFKKGNSVLNLQAREFIRHLDELSGGNLLREWIPLNGTTKGRVRVLADHDTPDHVDARQVFGSHANDHRILNASLKLAEAEPERSVILVSKDMNLRLKARALNLVAEDYETIKIRDLDELHSGHATLELDDEGPIDELFSDDGLEPGDIGLTGARAPLPNDYFILEAGSRSALAVHKQERQRLLPVHGSTAYGVTPRNAEQVFALHALLDPEVNLVTLTGSAGTGKTLLALAGALDQRRRFHQIFLARPIVPLANKDLGYLPGDVESKIDPYMQPLWDNLNFIKGHFDGGSRQARRIDEMINQDKLHVVPLAYIRGRSFSRVLFIVDEAQNLTPHEIKTVITRAGEGTKMVLTGDIFQIDTPYLDAQSNGLSYLVDRLKGDPIHAQVNLVKGERSTLANLASELL